MFSTLAHQFITSVAANPSGGTLSIVGLELPTDGYWVALPVASTTIDLGNPEDLDHEFWAEWLMMVSPENPKDFKHAYVGWWQDLDQPQRPIMVEPVRHIQTLGDALVVARALQQRYVFDIANKASILVE